jgi:hypothetical protein
MIDDNTSVLANDLQQLNLVPAGAVYNFEQLRQLIINKIELLINTDFQKLIQLLYTLDIPEKKLKELLATEHANAAVIISDLIIERQLQKIEMRKKFMGDNSDIPEDEKW